MTRARNMVFEPLVRMGPPPRSLAAEAHDCFMVRLPLGANRIQVCGAIFRALWRAPLGLFAFHRRHRNKHIAAKSVAATTSPGRRQAWLLLRRTTGPPPGCAAADRHAVAASPCLTGDKQAPSGGSPLASGGRYPAPEKPLDRGSPIQVQAVFSSPARPLPACGDDGRSAARRQPKNALSC